MKAVFYLSFSLKLSILLLILSLNSHLFGQTEIKNSVETEISSGAEYSIFLENMINSGNGWLLQHNGNIPNDPLYKTDLISTIEGINFNEDASNGGFYHIPPDPIGAAGPSHLVSVVNTSIEWHTKAGVQEVSMRLGKNSTTHIGSFFESLTPTTGTFDPKVIYDQYASRFVVVTLERSGTIDGSPSNISRILLAVSDDSDPNGTWYYHAIDSKLTIGVTDSWADYPGFAVDEEAVYVTANMFRFSGGTSLDSRIWIIAKSPFYSGGLAVVGLYDHGTAAGISGTYPTTQPAHMFGTPSSSTLGTFLVSSGWSSGATDFLSVIKVESPLSSPTFANTYISLGDIHDPSLFPDAPQLGTSSLIETNDLRALHAVWRSDILWVVNCVNPVSGTDAGQITVHWYKVSTSATPALSDQGNIGGESIASGCYTFFPSIAVNSSGAVCIGFSASASTIYPGCYFTGRLSTDPAGSTITPDVVKAGVDYYYRAFGGTRNRWGDYSGTCVDPSDDLTFYVFNEYALTRGTVLPSYPTEDGRWGTAFGIVPVSVLPVEFSSFTAKVLNSGGVQLKWRTETEVNNYGFDIELSQTSEVKGQTEWTKIGFAEGHGNSNSPKDYSFIDNNAGYGKYSYRLKQIDTDGQFEYSKIIEVDAGNIPSEIVLEQNYPNPFNPTTTIKFALAETQSAKLIIYDVLGNEVAIPFNGTAESGKLYEAEFNGGNLSSGIYFFRLETKSRTENRKMLLIK
jgi:hypothetical protein